MSLRFQCFFYFKSMTKFSFTHPFIVEHKNNYKFLMNMFEEVRLSIKVGYSYISSDIRVDFPWVNAVYEWWDDYVTTQYYYKKKHLYLYGPSNVGKSTIINQLLHGLGDLVFHAPSHKIGYPFDLFFDTHKCIVFEEFNILNWDIDFIKKLLAGDVVTLNRKYCDNKKYKNQNPVIMISNYLPPDSVEFRNRVVIVNAFEPFFQDTIGGLSITSTKDAFYVPSSPYSSEVSSPFIPDEARYE